MILDICLISNSCFYSFLPGGAFVFVRIHGSCDIEVHHHIYIGQSRRHWSMTKKESVEPFGQKWQAVIRRFSFLGVSAKDNSKH
jgi:hypothetical protein